MQSASAIPVREEGRQGLALLAMVLLGVASVFVTSIKPFMVTAYKQWLGYTEDIVGYLLALEFSGEVTMCLAVSARVHRWNRRTLAGAGLLTIVAGNLLSMLADSFATLAACRMLAGLGTGTALGVMSASLAGTTKPDRSFSIYTLALLAVGMVAFLALPRILKGYGLNAIFLILVIMTLPALATLRLLPRFSPLGVSARDPSHNLDFSTLNKSSVVVLVASALYFFGVGMVWPFVGELGKSAGWDESTVAYVLASTQAGGFLGALVAGVVDTRWGRSIPIALGLLGSATCLAALAISSREPWAFLVATPLFLFFWLYLFPYFNGVAASLEPSGRLTVVSMTIQSLGLAVGPALAGWLNVTTGGYLAILIAGIVMFVLTFPLLLYVTSKMVRYR